MIFDEMNEIRLDELMTVDSVEVTIAHEKPQSAIDYH